MRRLLAAVVAVLGVGGVGGGVGAGAAQAAEPAPYISVQNISKGVIGETSFGADTVTVEVQFKCHGDSDGTFLQVETVVEQGTDVAVSFGIVGDAVRCTGKTQKVTAIAFTDPFFGDTFEEGRATASTLIYGCPSGQEEFCDDFLVSKSVQIKLTDG